MIIKITKCSNSDYWYNNNIGAEVNVNDKACYNYKVSDFVYYLKNYPDKFIEMNDCIIIKGGKNEIQCL